jgi:hypothetical protein
MPAKDGFELQDADVELLSYVHQLRMAEIGHLVALSGRSEKALRARLLKLVKLHYLRVVRRFMQKNIYAIGGEGASVLVEHGHASREVAEKRLIRHNEMSATGIMHALFIVDIHVKLMLLTRKGPITISHWQEGMSLWDSAERNDGGKPHPVRPDAYFILQHAELPEGKNRRFFFLEADRGSMNHARMQEKLDGYLAYYEQNLHLKKYPGMRAFIVSTITRTRKRADELRKHLHPLIQRPDWRRAYPFIALEDLTLEALTPPAQ